MSRLHQLLSMLHCQDVIIASFTSSSNHFGGVVSQMHLMHEKTSFDDVRRNWVIFYYK